MENEIINVDTHKSNYENKKRSFETMLPKYPNSSK